MIRSLDITGARQRRNFADSARLSRSHQSSPATVKSSKRRGLTLVEVMICLFIVLAASIGTISAIVYTRLNMELEKQRIAALNYCRQAMEAMQSLDTAHADTKSLVPFNAPGIEDLNAFIRVEYYRLEDTGAVDWTTSMTTPSIDEPVFARVAVEWTPYGSISRRQQVSMSTVLTRGID